MPKAEETTLEIHLPLLKANVDAIRSRLKPNTLFLAVVKAFAYGSAQTEIALFLETLGVDYFAVAYVHEGVRLREAGVSKPILVLHPQPKNFKTLIAHRLEPSLYSFRVLKAFLEVAKSQKINQFPIHLKFNTGLNRLGFHEKNSEELVDIFRNNQALKVKSVFSHLAASEDLEEIEFTTTQITRFDWIAKTLANQLGYSVIRHLCNTSGILNFPEAHFDMVRCGIGMYGFGNSELENKHLTPIAVLKTIISQIHFIKSGDSIGYNRGYIADSDKRIATLPIGHADGIGRGFGNGSGTFWINGKPVQTIGNICMDMLMVDITHVHCKEGDEVVIFDAKHTAEKLAFTTNTISYEVITDISQRVRRLIVS